jgi:hypothetical protein
MRVRIILIAAIVIAIAAGAAAIVALNTITSSLNSGVDAAAHGVGTLLKGMSAPAK